VEHWTRSARDRAATRNAWEILSACNYRFARGRQEAGHAHSDVNARINAAKSLQTRNTGKKDAVCAESPLTQDCVEVLAILAAIRPAVPSEHECAADAAGDHFIKAWSARIPTPALSLCAENIGPRPGIADALARTPVAPHYVTPWRGLTIHGIQALLDNLERFSEDPRVTAYCSLQRHAENVAPR